MISENFTPVLNWLTLLGNKLENQSKRDIATIHCNLNPKSELSISCYKVNTASQIAELIEEKLLPFSVTITVDGKIYYQFLKD